MQAFIQYTLYLHILVGSVALLSGAIAIFSTEGKTLHRKTGKIYFWAMTTVFVTGIIVAEFRFNRFLFLIAFLSYYSVFAGVRFLKLKKLHRGQKPQWYDWAARGINTIANLVFVALGLYFYIFTEASQGAVLLTLGFGMGGMMISYTNLHPLVIRPTKPYHWYLAHIGNLMGGYIATLTAFLSTMVTRYELMNTYLAFALPSLIGIPLLLYWQQRTERQFEETQTESKSV
jgi:uncharacterized membrane protein